MKVEHDHIDPYRCYLYGPTPDGCAAKISGESQLYDSYLPAEADLVREELARVLDRFKTRWQPATVHASPSPTWRDESLADVGHSRLSRFVTRVHVFEASATRGEKEGSPIAGGRYLGFVCLRPSGSVRPDKLKIPHAGFRYVIEAELVRPRHMFRPRYHLIQTTTSAPRLGVLPFVSSVFMVPRQGVESSTCVHLAVSQALHLVMGRFGCKPISQREFEAHLWVQSRPTPIDTVARAGATLQNALDIVKDDCGGGGYIVEISELNSNATKDSVMQEAHRVLTDTLANGLPVIMMVNDRYLHPTLEKNEAHAALIFGMRLLHSGHELPAKDDTTAAISREDHDELPGIFIGHDSIKGPYFEWTAKELLEAAFACPTKEERPNDPPGIRFLALGPGGIKMGLNHARDTARKKAVLVHSENPKLFSDYFGKYCDPLVCSKEIANDPRQWRFVIRMVPMQEVLQRYLPKVASSPVQPNQPIDAQLTALAERLKASTDTTADFARNLHKAGYCWAVEMLLPAYNTKTPHEEPTNLPLLVFLWRVSAEKDSDPGAVLMLRDEGGYDIAVV